LAARARALASVARNPRSREGVEELKRIREQCARAGFGLALRAVDAALRGAR